MADSTIQWTESVWNPTTGCDRVSPGCGIARFPGDAVGGCYAMAMAKRLKAMGQAKYQRDGDPRTSGPGFGLTVHEDALTIPLRWKKPRRIFVNSMSDLFHDEVPDEFIHRVFAVMAATPQHTYQLLTKRHARMRSMLRDECRCGSGHQPGIHFLSAIDWAATKHSPTYVPGLPTGLYHQIRWPLPNVWVGVSVEDQKWADIRIPALRDTPAAVRWLSCEPLLDPINLSEHLAPAEPAPAFTAAWDRGDLGWVVAGGESGPNARPCNPDWLRSMRDQCQDAGVPFFAKQLGATWGRANGADSHGGDWDAWPADLKIRQYPTAQAVAA
jgi:protein gp37